MPATKSPTGDDPGRTRPQTAAGAPTRTGAREWLLSAGGAALAFLAGQHHAVMMVVLAVGLGDAAMGPMTAAPAVRRVMLAMSLLMAAAVGWRMLRSRRPRAMRVLGALSIAVTLALAAWTVARFGL
jgi:hypothetical protein